MIRVKDGTSPLHWLVSFSSRQLPSVWNNYNGSKNSNQEHRMKKRRMAEPLMMFAISLESRAADSLSFLAIFRKYQLIKA